MVIDVPVRSRESARSSPGSPRREAHAGLRGLVASSVAVVVLSGCASGAVFLRPVGGRSFSALSQPSPEPIGPFEGDDEARFEALSEAWHERLRARGVPGGALAVVIDGELRFAAGVGVRRLGSDLPVTRDTRFRVASVSKMVVAATVLSLASDGLLALDDPMRSIVPDFAAPPRADADIDRVTIERLLTHTAAIPDLACTDDSSLDETRRRWAGAPFWGPPGAFFNYSNFGYALLASAIAVTEGDDFRAVVARRVFARASMDTASYDAGGELAAGHLHGRVVWERPSDCDASQAAGGVIASVVDLARFAEALLAGGGAMLSTAWTDAMLQGRVLMDEPPRRTYGYGVMESERAGLRVVEHGGFAAGFVTLVRLVPERGFAVIVFANAPTRPADAADAAMTAFLDVDAEPPPPVLPSPETLASYEGVYEDEAGAAGRFELAARDGGLVARPRDGSVLPPDMTGTFVLGDDRRPRYFVTRVGVARRVE